MQSSNKFKDFKSFSEIVFPPEKLKIDPFLSRYYRPFSTRLSWLLYETGITPNFITSLQIFIGIFGCFIISYSSSRNSMFIGVIILHFAYLLDCVDGEIARAANLQSLKGVFLDKFAHFLTMPAILISVSFYYSQYLSNSNLLFFITFISCFATFNPINRLVIGISYQLAVKNKFKQYKIKEYFDNYQFEEKGLNNLLKDFDSKFQDIKKSMQLLKIIGRQFFRHVTYLVIITFLLILQYMSVNINFLIYAWILFLISIILKEILFLYLVLEKNFIENSFNKLLKSLNNFK